MSPERQRQGGGHAGGAEHAVVRTERLTATARPGVVGAVAEHRGHPQTPPRPVLVQAAAAAPDIEEQPGVVGTSTAEAAPEPEAGVPGAEPSAAQAGEQPPAAAAGAGPAGAGAGAESSPEELVKKLFDPLMRRLKTELRLDRERRGALTDLRH